MPEELIQNLIKAAYGIAGSGGLSGMPHPSRRAFVDALQAVLDAGVGIEAASDELAEALPRDFLRLSEPTRTFLVSSDGLQIVEADLPVDAMDYLSLVVFLRTEMDAAKLPYRDFSEMTRAAGEGRTLALGLAAQDRESLVHERIEPELRRLWHGDDARVEAEVRRLLAERQ